jgi:hypothetical protein
LGFQINKKCFLHPKSGQTKPIISISGTMPVPGWMFKRTFF